MKYLLLTIIAVMLTGCADSVSFNEASRMNPVGFWYGLWHGVIITFSWVISMFDSDVAVYAIYNNGGWYDFGFWAGIVLIVGGSRSTC